MIYYITGGERSGKSRYGQQMAEAKSDQPVYLATAKIWDDNFQERVDRHQSDRDDRWTTIEKEINLMEALPKNAVVMMDCVTLWLTNLFAAPNTNKQEVLEKAHKEVYKWIEYQGSLIVISNEIGMGLHANSQLGRDFVEVQGWVNQTIAEIADEAWFLVSGIPLKLK